jgi:hypothetical protein
LLALVACSSSPAPTTDEGKLRARLGVPPEAKTVVVFQQAAHLDIDWQRTFDEYYRAFVGDIFLEARSILDKQPRAFYSVTEMAYVQRHLDEHPEELGALQAHAARGALRVVGGGLTSPDTLLPETELILRDYLYGTRFAEETLGTRPRAAWLPDSFGHAATAPDLFAAAGFDSVGFARIDGAPTFFEVIAGARGWKPGSTAEQLQSLGSADFVWRGSGGGRVLAHFIASGLYCTGDNIDYDEQVPLPGGHLGVYFGDQPSFTDGKIDGYVAALAPLAATPYLFVPVGCDFQHPKEELVSYLDGYNRRRYPRTHVWAVAAPFDDYAQLVAAHRDALPEIAADLEPYFMGFYGSRAEVKRRVREAARPFFAAETFAVATGDAAPSLARLALTDHHDFVTGTANDRVADAEQLPLLGAAEEEGARAFAEVARALAAKLPAATGTRLVAFNPSGATQQVVTDLASAQPLHADGADVEPLVHKAARRVRVAAAVPPFGWRAIDLLPGEALPAARVTLHVGADEVVLSNERVRAVFARAGGWALTSLAIDGQELLSGRSFLVGDWTDQGGLWRLGNEMAGCALTPTPPPAAVEEVRVLDASRLSARVAFAGAGVREARLDAGDDGLVLAFTGGAREGTTRTVTFRFAPGALRTSLAGGYAERTPERVYTPTFWPAVEWASVGGAAVLLRQSTGVRFSPSGELELMAVRDARGEQCDIEGGFGSDTGTHRIAWKLTAAATPAAAARAAQAWNRPVAWVRADGGDGSLPPQGSLLTVEGDGLVSALKPADRGGGVIVRALLLPGPVTLHLPPALAARARTRTDALERDLAPLDGSGEMLTLDAATFGSIATVRLK